MELDANTLKTTKDTPMLREEYRKLRAEALDFGLVISGFDDMVETEIRHQDLLGGPRDWVYCGRLVLDTLYRDCYDDVVISNYWE
jgi:hypothetical protein